VFVEIRFHRLSYVVNSQVLHKQVLHNMYSFEMAANISTLTAPLPTKVQLSINTTKGLFTTNYPSSANTYKSPLP
jgi:hypothetical protein